MVITPNSNQFDYIPDSILSLIMDHIGLSIRQVCKKWHHHPFTLRSIILDNMPEHKRWSILKSLRGMNGVGNVSLKKVIVSLKDVMLLRDVGVIFSLDLTYCYLNWKMISEISKISCLRVLNLSYCNYWRYNDELVDLRIDRTCHLYALIMRDCSHLFSDGFALIREMSELCILDLENCEWVTDEMIGHLDGLDIEILNLSVCGVRPFLPRGLTWTGSTLHFLRELKVLHVYNRRGFNINVLEKLVGLETLSVCCGCDDDIKIIECLTNLHVLCL